MSTTNELLATGQVLQRVRGECDWLLQNFDLRKEARAEEVEALGRAMAVLFGADYSFLQVSAQAVPEVTLPRDGTQLGSKLQQDRPHWQRRHRQGVAGPCHRDPGLVGRCRGEP